MAEYRRIPDHQRDVFFEHATYAFRPENGPEEYDPEEDWPDLDQYNGLYDANSGDKKPLCICGHLWFDARIRGDHHLVPGLTAVATPPEHRRQGFTRRILKESLAEYRDRGAPLTVLWPFRTGFYRRYGWEIATELATYECPPTALSGVADRVDDEGSFKRLEPSDYRILARIYEAYAEDYALSIARDEEWWRERMLADDSGFVYAWKRDGEPRGYLYYDFEGGLGKRTMCVRERSFVDLEAYRHLLRFCRNHDSQVERIRLETPADDELFALVDEPESVDLTLETGPMVRIVDVVDALSAVSYPDESERVTLSVDDPLVDWNDAAFSLAVSGGEGKCSRTTAAPDARIDVGAFSQLILGYRSARDLDRSDRLETVTDDVTGALARLFPPTPTYLRIKF